MNSTPKANLRGEALREKVLSTALQLFSDKGYFNASVHDIRKAAGVSTGAIYHHFENKEALAKALYESLLVEMNQAVEKARQSKQGCYEQSRAVIKTMFQLTIEKPKEMQFVLLAQHREYLRDEPPICSSKPFQVMKSIVDQGMANGEVRQMDSWVAAAMMFGGAIRMMGLQLDDVLDVPLNEVVDQVVESAWLGVKA
ncbi:MAG: TetR/AcrR family transcriptional regulator [Candidatus Pacebacteria bacterium]|nr:TetR/AcrR family transcriptional regulator [Candidatus Paceibacterota bacterium]